ncbi:hypothetical protein VNO78_24561 [Psophocarpus tetragonolobus]|uniref:Uncharacterized protein n=1 Tax=Psophocarpus tetragonolobus TaxID=3891 RepID=A0AAN9S590_PSOTE
MVDHGTSKSENQHVGLVHVNEVVVVEAARGVGHAATCDAKVSCGEGKEEDIGLVEVLIGGVQDAWAVGRGDQGKGRGRKKKEVSRGSKSAMMEGCAKAKGGHRGALSIIENGTQDGYQTMRDPSMVAREMWELGYRVPLRR